MNYPQGYSPEPDEVSADVNGERSFATLRQRTQQTVLRSAKEEGRRRSQRREKVSRERLTMKCGAASARWL
jgi:hypothetical protein